MGKEVNDVYFRSFFVPLTITILILCGIAVIIANVPGAPMENAMAGGFRQIAGALRRLVK